MVSDDTKPHRILPDPDNPGGRIARALGCICSPERNNDGYGVETDKGLTFYPNNDCPLHGIDAVMEIWREQGGKPVKR